VGASDAQLASAATALLTGGAWQQRRRRHGAGRQQRLEQPRQPLRPRPPLSSEPALSPSKRRCRCPWLQRCTPRPAPRSPEALCGACGYARGPCGRRVPGGLRGVRARRPADHGRVCLCAERGRGCPGAARQCPWPRRCVRACDGAGQGRRAVGGDLLPSCLSRALQEALEAAHRAREMRGASELQLELFDAATFAAATALGPLGQGGSAADAAMAAAASPPLPAPRADEGVPFRALLSRPAAPGIPLRPR